MPTAAHATSQDVTPSKSATQRRKGGSEDENAAAVSRKEMMHASVSQNACTSNSAQKPKAEELRGKLEPPKESARAEKSSS